ncbi:tetratricopeptide repeat protein [Desulfonema magnum]|uniref:Tetratricopeptide repeat-containing protein n=1 Tax=Desulfonema magnum TaxID=45655 RepID=A0A975BKA9_9BACT|nr:tetratricopeptide repeat protein [Desulfonema magnum]QTA86963.1 Tetratricopeptide repeat-containing protein [Desulfonema magnum]
MIIKIVCPKCETIHHIDSAQIPDNGTYGRCSKCQNSFLIKKEVQKPEQVTASDKKKQTGAKQTSVKSEKEGKTQNASQQHILRKVERGQVAAAIFDFFVIAFLFQTFGAFICAAGGTLLAKVKLPIGQILSFFLVFLYHQFYAKEILFCSAGERMAGCRIIGNRKEWTSPFSCSRWLLFIILFMLLLYPLNAFEAMEQTGDWKLIPVIGRTVFAGIFIVSVWRIALGYFKWSVAVCLLLSLHIGADILTYMPASGELAFITIENNLFSMSFLILVLLFYDKNKLPDEEDADALITDAQRMTLKKIATALVLLVFMMCLLFNGWNIYWYHQGNARMDRGDSESAVEAYTRALKLKPHDTDAYIKRGKAWSKKGNFDQAVADFTTALELKPHNASVYVKRGKAWYGKGDFGRAIADFTTALELKPHKAAVYVNRGRAWDGKGRSERAIADFTRALDINPYDADTYMYRGIVWDKKGDFDQAVSDFNNALSINPYDPDIYYNRGLTWENKGDSERAEEDFNKSELLRQTR